MDELTKKAVTEAFKEEFSLKKILIEFSIIIIAVVIVCCVSAVFGK